MKKKMKKRSFVALLMAFLMLASNMSILAATPETSSVKVPQARLVESVTSDTQAEASIGLETSDDTTVTPRSIYGYAAKYTNPMEGSFTVSSSGSSSTRGTFQITTHDFPNSPAINAVLYRPDGTYACQIYINGNGTKSVSFSNAMPGTYKIVYGVDGVNGGWISAWVSS